MISDQFAFLAHLRLWGILLADVVIQMLGTDYARVLRAIYAIAQVICHYYTCLDAFCIVIVIIKCFLVELGSQLPDSC